MNIPPYLSIMHDTEQLGTHVQGCSLSAFDRVDAGTLIALSGRIVACDPLTSFDRSSFARTIAPGMYPVNLGVCKDAEGTNTIIYAMLRLRLGLAVTWDLAFLPGENDAKADNDFPGYSADTGTGCFMDAEIASEYALRMLLDDTNVAQDVLFALDRSYRDGRNWANIPFDEFSDSNMIAFSTGNGTGKYMSYWGLDADGEPVALVTDFGLLG